MLFSRELLSRFMQNIKLFIKIFAFSNSLPKFLIGSLPFVCKKYLHLQSYSIKCSLIDSPSCCYPIEQLIYSLMYSFFLWFIPLHHLTLSTNSIYFLIPFPLNFWHFVLKYLVEYPYYSVFHKYCSMH